MLKNRLMIYLASIAIALFAFSSCSEDTGTNPGTDKPFPSPVSGLQATSINDSTVELKFISSSSESNSLFNDYEISWKSENGPTLGGSDSVAKGVNRYEVTKLVEGTIYLFTVTARYNDTVSTPVTVRWSPASRFDVSTNDDTETIKVYETASTSFGSGLQLYSSSEKGPMTYKVAGGGKWDLGINTKDNKITFGSATKLAYDFPTGQTPAVTQVLSEVFYATSLNELFDNQAMNTIAREAQYSEQIFDLANISNPANAIFYVRKVISTTSYNYAKVMIKRATSGGSFLQGTAPNRYIEVQISYQKVAGVPYAKTANNNDTN